MNASKNLSAEELRFIDGFCKKKDIKYVDLRIELVDHLAELVLARQEKFPNENFKDAFYAVYKSYGIFGFLDVAQEHESQMQKRYWREIWRYTKQWLTPPKVVLTFALSIGLYFILDTFEALRYPSLILLLALFGLSIGLTVMQFLRNKKILNGEQSILMGGAHQGFFWFIYVFMQIPLRLVLRGDELNLHPGLLTPMLVLTIIFGLANYFLQEKAKTQLEELKAQMM